MRIIAGQFRSRRIKTMRGLHVRPTPDRLRETLFNVITPRLPGAIFVDAYAGCGAVGLEALSRGAARVIFLEWKRSAARMIQQNLRSLGVTEGFEIHCGKAASLLRRLTGDIVFLDPPYALQHEYRLSLDVLGENPPPLVIVQHAWRHELNERDGSLRRTRLLRQGDNALSFYEPE